MKKLVYRADDIGYTLAFDLGAFKGIDEGIVTSADVMLDSPHTVEALQWLKERPWISVGWHRHLWESPVAPKEAIPSMVDEEGRFKWRHNQQELMKQVPYAEAYTEFCAELDRCVAVLGRVPDTAMVRDDGSELERAFKDVCDQYGIVYGHCYSNMHGRESKPLPKYEHLNYKMCPPGPKSWRDGGKFTFYDLTKFADYDTEQLIMDIEWENEDDIMQTGGHPGYLDEHILAESSCTIHRPKELLAAISPRVKEWIIKNRIELVNQRDVLHGTHEYQNHLKEINSPLWVGNFK